jgi:RimJ/RimL family protein N-acetyltransferase
MEIRAESFVLRPWGFGDEAALVRHANDREIWRNLRDRFPHPYTQEDAQRWIRHVQRQGRPPLNFALVLDGEPVGGVGLERRTDVHRSTAEIGYWIGRAYWGRGLATEAARRLTQYAFDTFPFERLEAGVFAWNPASCRVLEKAGYTFEARIRRNICKDGQVLDTLLYSKLRPSSS